MREKKKDKTEKNWKENKTISEAMDKLENKRFRSVVRWVFEIAVTLAFAALVAIMLFQSVTMQESSMEPTLSVGDKYFVNRLVYKVSSPKRGDIIVFRTNGSDDAALHIRRVIGLPGETVQITDGAVYINGEKLDESAYGFDAILNGGLAEEQIVLDDDEYFVLGDNRNGSGDSRYTDIGNVGLENIIGTVWFRVWPFQRIGSIR